MLKVYLCYWIRIQLILYRFFFSSRRRHTRWPRDWSSDVCSSDLGIGGQDAAAGQVVHLGPGQDHLALPVRVDLNTPGVGPDVVHSLTLARREQRNPHQGKDDGHHGGGPAEEGAAAHRRRW